MASERTIRLGLAGLALGALLAGLALLFGGHGGVAAWIWAAGTAPIVAALGFSMVRDFMAGRAGVDAVAFVSMSAALGLGEPLAGVVVALMYSGGNVLEDVAVARAERNLRSLIDRAPRIVHRRNGDTVEDVAVETAVVGDRILVRAGEVIPVDGVLVSAGALIDESALTGEPVPAHRRVGDEVRSGTVNAGEIFDFTATATAGGSTYAGIVRMVTAAQTAKAPFMRIADRYAILLLPATIVVAGLAWYLSGDPIRALAVLVAATPCPLILAAPVAFIGGVSQAARNGILVKGGRPLEALANVHTVLFDKTGTLTIGGARLVAIETAPGGNADEVLRLAGALEQASHHVVAAAIVAAARAAGLALPVPLDVRESLGSGIEGTIEGRRVCVGSPSHVFGGRGCDDWAVRAIRRASWRSALAVFVAVDGRAIGALLLGDEMRRETPRAIRSLRSAGVKRIVMVTGDRIDAAETIGAALDLDGVLADRVPADKVDAVMTERRRAITVMVGDGINDAPALAAADVGIAMGARGASASSEAADVVILDDRLDRVPGAIAIARRARGIAIQSIVVGMALSGVAMLAAALGYLTPVAGALTQEAIDVAVILNALRALAPGRRAAGRLMPSSQALALQQGHDDLRASLDRLRAIADGLDDADAERATALIKEAHRLVEDSVVAHERGDEVSVYPDLTAFLADSHGLAAMSRAHREILHLARLLGRLAAGVEPRNADRYLIRDAQRVIESIEALVRIHSAQEEDIYDHAAAG
jgi:heavy metal translocating P-type ATPase